MEEPGTTPPTRVRTERFFRHLQTIAVLIAMAGLFVVTAVLLFGGTGLAILVAMGFVLLLFVGRQEVQVDTSQVKPLKPEDHSALHSILDELSDKAGIPAKPEPYILPVEQMNAATMGKEGQPILAVTRPMLTELSDRELRAILAHEIAHIEEHDRSCYRLVTMLQVLTMTVARIGWFALILLWPMAALGGWYIPPYAIGLLLGAPVLSVLLQAALSRSREYSADLGAVELTNDPEGLAMALERIDKRQEQLWRQVLPIPQQRRRKRSILRTHPAQEQRVQKLKELARS